AEVGVGFELAGQRLGRGLVGAPLDGPALAPFVDVGEIPRRAGPLAVAGLLEHARHRSSPALSGEGLCWGHFRPACSAIQRRTVSGRQRGILPVYRSGSGSLPADRSRSTVRRLACSNAARPSVENRGSSGAVVSVVVSVVARLTVCLRPVVVGGALTL